MSAAEGEGVLQYHPDPGKVVRENFAVNKLFAEMLDMEREARSAVATSQAEIASIVKDRRQEEIQVKLKTSFYDTIHQVTHKHKYKNLQAHCVCVAF